jgi:hypothetical protein
MSMVLFLLATCVFSEKAIVKIGDKAFGQSEIKKLMNSQTIDPFIVINKLKKDAVVKMLAQKRKADLASPASSLYKQIFDADYETEKMKVEIKDIPPLAKTAEVAHLNLFDQWIETMADEMVPVIYLDQKEFWSLMQSTKPYAVRKEAGYEPKLDNWEYTRAELAVDPAMVVATKSGSSYITGTEMNAYIMGNFNGIRTFAKRGKSINEVRTILTKYVISGKLTAESVMNKSFTLDSVDMERATDRFIQRSMKDEDFSLKGVSFGNAPRAMDVVYNSYKEKNQDKLNEFKRVLKGEIRPTIDNKNFNLCLMETAEVAVHRKIAKAVTDDELYDWMKTNKFSGSPREAREEIASEKYHSDIEAKIKDQGISMTVFPVK